MKKMVKRIKKALSRHKAIKKIYAITLLVLQTTRSTIRMHIGRLMRGGGDISKIFVTSHYAQMQFGLYHVRVTEAGA